MGFKSGFSAAFKTVAPFLSTTAQMAVPGPLGAMAAGIISKVAGKDVKPSDVPDVMAQMAQTDEGMLKLKQADLDYQARLKQMDINSLDKLEAIHEQDMASARQREVDLAKSGSKDNTPKVLTGLIASLAVLVIGMVFSGKAHAVLADGSTAALAGTIVGYVFRDLAQVVSYYFGSSSGSDRKTELLAESSPPAK